MLLVEKMLFDDISTIIPKKHIERTNLIRKLIGNRVIDAVLFFPINVVVRKFVDALSYGDIGGTVIVKFVPTYIEERKIGKIAMRVFGNVADQELVIVFFNLKSAAYFKSRIKLGVPILVCGKLNIDGNGIFEIAHPDEFAMQNIAKTKSVYSLTNGVDSFLVSTVVANALAILMEQNIEEWIPNNILQKNKWVSFKKSIMAIHSPEKYSDITLDGKYLQRLCFDECYANNTAQKLANNIQIVEKLTCNKILYNQIIHKIGFDLTVDQLAALKDIESDLISGRRMSRLVQGDVGSGKTVIALLTAALVVGSGFQVAVLAPTELLARQHYNYFSRYSDYVGILTSSETGRQRREILYGIETGILKIVIGTHALISETVKFKNLNLVIVDEQHRFGVNQRLQLINKGRLPHVLSMTATPIPRTLILTMSGDVSVSSIRTKPKGRLPIITRVFPISRIAEIVHAIEKVIANGKQVYWVCPLIEESEKLDYTCVINRFTYIQKIFGHNAVMMHGKMNVNERSAAFQAFLNKDATILVSTTIIEVGVDVPSASLIVIENAEKFGLAQLHQLRGRVGRSAFQSYCFLLYEDNIGKLQRERLAVIRNSSDGFEIAEKDLQIRGGGEVLGIKQSGSHINKTYRLDDINHAEFIYYCIRESSAIKQTPPAFLMQTFLPDNFKDIKKSF